MEFVVNRSTRSYGEDAFQIELTDDPLEDSNREILEGNPVVSSEMLSVHVSEGGLVIARGIMRCTPGKYKDEVEDDEFFTVISGRATIEIDNSPDNCILELNDGSVGELRKGTMIVVTVHDTLLKSFQLTMCVDDGEEEGSDKGNIKAEQNFAISNYSVLGSAVSLEQEMMQEGECWINSDPPPEVTSALLSTVDNGLVMRGLWRCTEGSCTYFEQDELFTVLEGRAKVTVKARKSDPTRQDGCIDLKKGMVGEFKHGDVATFLVQGDTPFLKSFQITGLSKEDA